MNDIGSIGAVFACGRGGLVGFFAFFYDAVFDNLFFNLNGHK
jgi:hypothetical protein